MKRLRINRYRFFEYYSGDLTINEFFKNEMVMKETVVVVFNKNPGLRYLQVEDNIVIAYDKNGDQKK